MVLITGATGILGQVLALYLVQNGKEVLAVKRPTSDLSEVKNSFKYYTENPETWFDKIQWIDVDFKDITAMEEALKNVEEVYHCAGKVSFNEKDKKEIFETNILGTKNWLYACDNSSVKKFCFVSSIAVLDGLNENGALDENSDYNPKIHHSSYAISKHFAEMEVWRASAEGLSTVIINPAVILGSGNWHKSSGEIFDIFEKTPYCTSGGTAYVDVRDVARSAIALMDYNQFGERFIIASENKTYQEVGNIIRKKSKLPPLKMISDNLLKKLTFLSKLSFIFPKLNFFRKSNIQMLTSNQPISNEKIKNTLSIDFISVEDSLNFHLNNKVDNKF